MHEVTAKKRGFKLNGLVFLFSRDGGLGFRYKTEHTRTIHPASYHAPINMTVISQVHNLSYLSFW